MAIPRDENFDELMELQRELETAEKGSPRWELLMDRIRKIQPYRPPAYPGALTAETPKTPMAPMPSSTADPMAQRPQSAMPMMAMDPMKQNALDALKRAGR